MSTADEVYTGFVLALAQSEKLRLATMILDELAVTAAPVLDFSDSWSTEDMRDVAAVSQQNANARYPESTDLA
jgi:hypothetical protein